MKKYGTAGQTTANVKKYGTAVQTTANVKKYGTAVQTTANVKKYGTAGQITAGNTVRRTRFACWVTNATNTHSEYVILTAFFFSLQQWLR